MPATRAVDQGLYFGQHASNHSFDFGGGWVQVAGSVEHRPRTHRRKPCRRAHCTHWHDQRTSLQKRSCIRLQSWAGSAPRKEARECVGLRVCLESPRAPREWRLARIHGACRSREVPRSSHQYRRCRSGQSGGTHRGRVTAGVGYHRRLTFGSQRAFKFGRKSFLG